MTEAKTFLKVPGQEAGGDVQMPPVPEQMPQTGMPPMPMDGGMPQQGPESEFDTGFDAGVEADEDEDPKKFIQQLTGKLSQSLNTYNNENGDDEELSKYVGKMIVKAAAKALDEKGRKELIKSINTTEEDTDEEDTDDGDEDVDINIDTEEAEGETPQPQGQQPIQECVFTKAETKNLARMIREHLSRPSKSVFSGNGR